MFDEEAVGCNVDTVVCWWLYVMLMLLVVMGFVTAVFVGTNGFVELIG